jgi:NADH-quinone oxidoreductase subunit G
MLEIEIDGVQMEVQDSCTIMDVANQIGTYIPHFCYHKKLSIAANCRMCLVEVEKLAKPVPACATPVTEGMKIFTRSKKATEAQHGVMEFLLINHPLDCPICDQGGECPLQDLAVGYGGDFSRYQESKRVVSNKDLGALIATEMTRCIHCTRCVRFGQEVAGVMELGLVGRGEHVEIMPFVERTVDSELSGNMIDICPVGALTSKPFRYTARAWELSRRTSISPHCGLGTNLLLQTKQNRVMRVLPRENEDINECWLSDKDRFSYEGLNSSERLSVPMLKHNGAWQETEWQTALEFIAQSLANTVAQHGAEAIGALATPHSTLEELYLLQKLLRGIGSDNVEFRLRQSDFSADKLLVGVPWLGMKIREISELDRVLIVGSFLRKDHPLIAHRIRQMAKRGAEVSLINPVDDDLNIKVTHKVIIAPRAMVDFLAQVLGAALKSKNLDCPAALRAILQDLVPSEGAIQIANSLISGERQAIFLGNMAQQHPRASQLHYLTQELAAVTGARFGFLGEAANSVGGYIAAAVPLASGAKSNDLSQILQKPLRSWLLLNTEAELDTYNPQATLAALRRADLVVALSPYKHKALEYAHVMLPISPFSETSGTYISTEGRVQSFTGVVTPLGETRPAWKVLRVLGNLMRLQGFDYDSSEAVRTEVLGEGEQDLAARLNNRVCGVPTFSPASNNQASLQRIAQVPIYHADAVVRRAMSLQQTKDAQPPLVTMHSHVFQKLGLTPGNKVRVKQDNGEAILDAKADDNLPLNCVRVAAAHPATSGLGEMYGEITVEQVN